MKLLSKINIQIKRGYLPHFINELCKSGCSLKSLESLEMLPEGERFTAEVLYDAAEQFRNVVQKFKRHPENFSVECVSNLLEESLRGGMLNVCGKGKFETKADYEMMVQGAAGMIVDKIRSGERVEEFSGAHHSVAMINCMRFHSEKADENRFIFMANAERDSVVLKKFSGLNGFPLLMRADHPEDIIKILKSIEESFAILRLMTLEGASDVSLVSYINSEVKQPMLYREYDELPLLLTYAVMKISRVKRLAYDDCNAGVIGLDLPAIRLTRLLKLLGFSRVLGCDNNEKCMMNVEKEGALATTQENIFSNSDIIFLFKNHFTVADLSKVRPGQVIVSLLGNEEIDHEILAARGVRDFISSEFIDLSVVFPGLVNGMKRGAIHHLEDQHLLRIAADMADMKMDALFPDVFGDVHELISQSLGN